MDKCLDEHSITLANKRRLFDHFLWWQGKNSKSKK
jgi:hypothetical protein